MAEMSVLPMGWHLAGLWAQQWAHLRADSRVETSEPAKDEWLHLRALAGWWGLKSVGSRADHLVSLSVALSVALSAPQKAQPWVDWMAHWMAHWMADWMADRMVA
jgi:hypothetical protein